LQQGADWHDLPHYGAMWYQRGRNGELCHTFANNPAVYGPEDSVF